MNAVWRDHHRTFHTPRLVVALFGFVPIASLCIALFGLVPLHLSAMFLVLPVFGVTILLGLHYPQVGRLALLGLVAGMIATGIYDMVRFAFVWSTALPDFIPVIGRMALLDETAHPGWGYLWRYLGNGGAMGMTFAMLPWRSVGAALLYGTGICSCLFLTLILAPNAQQALFPLTMMTASAALLGHLVYGGVLGYLICRWDRPVESTENQYRECLV